MKPTLIKHGEHKFYVKSGLYTIKELEAFIEQLKTMQKRLDQHMEDMIKEAKDK